MRKTKRKRRKRNKKARKRKKRAKTKSRKRAKNKKMEINQAKLPRQLCKISFSFYDILKIFILVFELIS